MNHLKRLELAKITVKGVSLGDAFGESFFGESNRIKLARHWAALAGCLAYTESLGDPDTPTSVQRARQLIDNSFVKPAGVKFYYDPGHSNPLSRWNIGLYQFVLHRGGNILPCVRSWRSHDLPASVSLLSLDKKDMGRFVGSPAQSFNAFCGVNKILQTFFVQLHTNRADRTHPDNLSSTGSLKPPSERCVSLHHRRAYAHFGPLIRTVPARNGNPSNLEKVMSCAMSVSID